MPITNTTHVDRVLIVLNPDGTLKGAHAEKLRRVADGATVLQETIMPAEPLTADMLAAVIPKQAALAAQVAALAAERDAAVAAKAQAEAALATAVDAPDEAGFAPLTAVQLRLGLLGAGITRQHIDAAIAAMPDALQREAASTTWEYSISYRRAHPLVSALGAALGLDAGRIDKLWRHAATL